MQLSFFEQFGLAIKSYVTAISFIFDKGLWKYFIYSLLISALLVFGGFEIAKKLSDAIENGVLFYVNFNSGAGTLSFLGDALHFLLNIGLKIVFFFIFSTFSKYILLIIMSPVMALISERTEEIVTGKIYPFNILQFMKDILRGVIIALRNMFIEFGFIFLGFFIVWIPVIGWLSTLFLFVLSYYFYGFSMIDYFSERRRLGISQSVRYVRKNKGLAIGNGFIFSLLFAIPFIGGMIVAVVAPVAACIAVLEIEKGK
ncbi:MAG: EI24 domain-containing protein [Bacteroidetes bacterium]|nr:EI24 domain-containing protein [Bacteroidota bacterium]